MLISFVFRLSSLFLLNFSTNDLLKGLCSLETCIVNRVLSFSWLNKTDTRSTSATALAMVIAILEIILFIFSIKLALHFTKYASVFHVSFIFFLVGSSLYSVWSGQSCGCLLKKSMPVS